MQQKRNQDNYTNEQNNHTYLKEAASAQQPKTKRSKITFYGVLALLILLIAILCYQLFTNLSHINTLEKELETNQEEFQVATDYQDELTTYVAMLQDEEYVAELARSEYYLSDENDIVFNFINGDSSILSDVNESEAAMEKETQDIEEENGE